MAEVGAAAETAPGPYAAEVVDAVWALQQLRLELTRRDLATVSTAVIESGAVGLAEALAEEVGRIREEIGTPGEFRSELTVEPSTPGALLALRATEVVLAILTRRSDAYDLAVSEEGERIVVSVVCEGADDTAAADTDAVGELIALAGGRLVVDRDEDGRMRAHLSVPSGERSTRPGGPVPNTDARSLELRQPRVDAAPPADQPATIAQSPDP